VSHGRSANASFRASLDGRGSHREGQFIRELSGFQFFTTIINKRRRLEASPPQQAQFNARTIEINSHRDAACGQ